MTKSPATPVPKPGDLFAIPLRKGWWGAAKLIRTEPCNAADPSAGLGFRFLVFDGYWKSCPTPNDVAGRDYVKQPFHHHPDPNNEWKAWFSPAWPPEFPILAPTKLTKHELDEAATSQGTYVYQSAKDFARRLYDYRQWLDDPEAFEAEQHAAVMRKFAKEAKAKESMTLEQMAKARPFGEWKTHWPEVVIKEARRIFREATKELISLEGAKKRKQKIAVLRGIVDGFNELDEAYHCIDTVEREAVIARIEDLASLVGIKNNREQLTGHRVW